MQDRYRALQDMVRLPTGAGEALMYTPLERQAVYANEKELALLSRCGRFATLHEHASRAQGPMVSATASFGGAVSQLQRLVDRGLLVSERDLTERVQAMASAEDAPPPVASLGLPTGGRHDLAVQAVESYVGAKTDGRQIEIVVAHDARDEEESDALVRAIGAVDVGDEITLRYAGPSQRSGYAARLAERADVDPELVRWALLRRHPEVWAVGVLRNALTLDGVGTLMVMMDDDVRSEIAAPPILEDGLAITSAGSVMEFWFPAPGRDADSLVSLAPGDVVSVLEEMLGASLGACIEGASALDLCDASGEFVREILAGRGRVRCSQMGLSGDSATGSIAHYLMLKGTSRERLVVTEGIYDHAFASRQGTRAARRAAVSDGPFCMSYAIGLDLREPLPPFPPEGRNSDGVFGYVYRFCFRDSYFGYRPEVVAHRPPARSSSIEDVLAGMRQIDNNDLLCRVIGHSGFKTRSADAAGALEHLGAHLERLGGLPLADLEEMVRTLTLRTRSRDMAMLRATLAAHHQRPAYWARDCNALVEHLAQVVLEDDHTYPRDLVRAYGQEEGRAGLARVARDYGRLLRAWPRIVAAAGELRAEGCRPSSPWP